jgi:hypothetical protein
VQDSIDIVKNNIYSPNACNYRKINDKNTFFNEKFN